MDSRTERRRNRLIWHATLIVIASRAMATSSPRRVPPTARPTTQTEPTASSRSLQPIPYPSLSNLEKVVQDQLQEAQGKLTALSQKSGATDKELSQSYGELGKLYQAYDLTDAALACFSNAQTLDPHNFDWQYYLGYIYQKQNKLDDAFIYFTNALKIR